MPGLIRLTMSRPKYRCLDAVVYFFNFLYGSYVLKIYLAVHNWTVADCLAGNRILEGI